MTTKEKPGLLKKTRIAFRLVAFHAPGHVVINTHGYVFPQFCVNLLLDLCVPS